MSDERLTFQGWQGQAPAGADYLDLHLRMHLREPLSSGVLFAGTDFAASAPAFLASHGGTGRSAVIRHFVTALLDYLEGADVESGPRPDAE